MPQIDVYDTPELLAASAGELFVELAHQAIQDSGTFNALLSGGTTPRAVYRWLAEHGEMLDWHRVRLFFGDERCVPPEHPDSNYRMVRESMLDALDGLGVTTYRIPAEYPPAEAASRYETLLRSLFDGTPVFDLVLLGLGADAHTASLFPGTQAIHEEQAWVVAHYIESVAAWRITVTPPLLNNAKTVAFIVSGEGKAAAVEAVLRGGHAVDVYPAQVIQPLNGSLRWLLDIDAAKLILSG